MIKRLASYSITVQNSRNLLNWFKSTFSSKSELNLSNVFRKELNTVLSLKDLSYG